MRAIARKDRKRKADDPLKATTYRLRKRTVPPQRIERYKKDHHITDDTAISEAGMLKRNADFTFANGDTGLATPSDLSCDETPRSSLLDGSPIHASPLVPYKPLGKSTPTCCVDCETWMSITSGTPPRLPLSQQLCDQMSNVNPSLGVPRLVEHAYSDRNLCCSAREYVELLQSLVSTFYGSGLVNANAAFYQHTIHCQIMAFRNTDDEGTLECCLPVSEAHGVFFPCHSNSWSNQLTHRLMDIFERILNKNEKIDRIIARIHQFSAKVCVEKTLLSPPSFQTVVDTTSRYKLALRDRACVCHMCNTLPQLLTSETLIVASCLDALSPAEMAPIKCHSWYKRIEEMTQKWLRGRDDFNLLHSFYRLRELRARLAHYDEAVGLQISCADDEIAIEEPNRIFARVVRQTRVLERHFERAWELEKEIHESQDTHASDWRQFYRDGRASLERWRIC